MTAEQSYGVEYESKLGIVEVYTNCPFGVEEGLHSHLSLDNIKGVVLKDEGLILCKIPKASLYVVGDCNDIVSSRLILLYPLISNNLLLEKFLPKLKNSFNAYTKIAKTILNSYNIKLGI